MIRYFIRPIDRNQRSKAWATTFGKAKTIKSQLQSVTGLKWRITIEEITQDGYTISIG